MNTIENKCQVKNVENFVLAGKAIFTIKNPRTGRRFTYKVAEPKRPKFGGNFRFVSVLSSGETYVYIGIVCDDGTFRWTKNARVGKEAPSVKAFSWFWRNLKNLGPVEVWHEGRCGRCGRPLTVPESIASGLGPVCAKMV